MADADAHRLVVRGGRSAALGYMIRFGARLLFLLLAARLFGAALFGAYSLAIAAVELAVAVGGLGMKRLLFKLLDERPADRSATHVLVDAALSVLVASLLLAALMMSAAKLLPTDLLAANTAAALFLVAPMVAGQTLLDLMLAATRWKHRMRYEVAARSIVEPYGGIAALLAAYLLGLDETGLLVSYWAGTLAALAYSVAGVRRCFGAPDLRHYRPAARNLRIVLGESLFPTGTDLLAAMFARLDLYLVGILLGESPAGVYAMARQIRTPVRQVRQSFDGMLTPILARTLAARGPVEAGRASASATRLILAIQLPVMIGLIIVAEPLLASFGREFAAGFWALVILAAAETILGAFGIGELILFYRRPALTLWLTSASILIQVAAAWLLIDRFGLIGAALSVLIAVSAAALLRRILLRTGFGVRIPLSYSAGPVVSAAAAIGAALLTAILLGSTPSLLVHGAALIVAIAAYALALRLWVAATGERLSLANLQLQ